MLDGDRDFIAAMRAVREQRGMTQKDLADHMRALGCKWSQSTVWSIERGDRPVRIGEAVEVANLLGFPLTHAANSADVHAELAEARRQLRIIKAVINKQEG